MTKRVLIVVGVFLAVSFWCGAVHAAINAPGIAKDWNERIHKLVAEGKNAQAEAQCVAFISWLRGIEKKYPKVTNEFCPGAYNTQANCEARQGKYNEAANTTRAHYAWKPSSGLVDRVVRYEQNANDQQTFYQKSMDYHIKKLEIRRKTLDLVQEKNKLVKDMLSKKSITQEEMTKFQAAMKAINEKITPLNKELTDLATAFTKDTEKFRAAGIVFNAKQREHIQQKVEATAKVNNQIYKINTAVSKGLIEIAEKFKYSWDGLEANLTKMNELQKKIMDLQNKMLGLMAKNPMTDADKKELRDLNAQVDKLMIEHDKLLGDLEKGFMDTKTFSKLTPAEQDKFLKLFAVIRDAHNVIDRTNAKIDAFLKEMDAKFGDINGDGKIDRADLDAMRRKYLEIAVICIWPPVKRPYDKAADLDGDGAITWSDYNLLAEAVFGDRKTFPVDPNNKPGDLDGNGHLDEEDVYTAAKIMMNPKAWSKYMIKIADLNGDGKVDITDIQELIKRIEDQKKEIEVSVAVEDNASATQGVGQSGSTTTGESGESGTQADSLNDAY